MVRQKMASESAIAKGSSKASATASFRGADLKKRGAEDGGRCHCDLGARLHDERQGPVAGIVLAGESCLLQALDGVRGHVERGHGVEIAVEWYRCRRERDRSHKRTCYRHIPGDLLCLTWS